MEPIECFLEKKKATGMFYAQGINPGDGRMEVEPIYFLDNVPASN